MGELSYMQIGAVKGSPSMAAVGGLIRDDTGRWLSGFMHNIRVSTSIGVEFWIVK